MIGVDRSSSSLTTAEETMLSAQTRARRQGPPLALLVLLALAVAPVIAGRFDGGYLVPIGTEIIIYALAASSLNVVVGHCGVFSLGHAAFIAIGAYTVAIASQYAGPSGLAAVMNQGLVTWPLAVLLACGLAFLAALVCVRREGLTLAMITLAMGQMVYLVLVALRKFGGDDGLNMYPRNVLGPLSFDADVPFYYLSLSVLAAYLLATHVVMRSRFGRLVDAVAINPIRTATLGFSVFWVRVACFVFSALGATLAGILFANANEFVSPSLGNWSVSGQLLVMIVIGGIATRAGPLLGAFVYVAVLHVASDYVENTGLIMGAVVVSVVIFMPRGVLPALERRRPA